MPNFRFSLDNQPPEILGGTELDILTLGVISVQGEQDAYLQVTSMNKISAESEMLYSKHLARGAQLQVEFLQDYVPRDPMPKRGPDIVLSNDAERSGTGRIRLALRLKGSRLIIGSADDNSSLHVAANWVKAANKCVLEMACIRLTEVGQNQMVLEHEILSGESFEIIVV